MLPSSDSKTKIVLELPRPGNTELQDKLLVEASREVGEVVGIVMKTADLGIVEDFLPKTEVNPFGIGFAIRGLWLCSRVEVNGEQMGWSSGSEISSTSELGEQSDDCRNKCRSSEICIFRICKVGSSRRKVKEMLMGSDGP